jgi:hypothetical protein
MKQNKKKIYDSKIFWMILSLLASTILWAYISSQDTTAISATLKGVQVQFSGRTPCGRSTVWRYPTWTTPP